MRSVGQMKEFDNPLDPWHIARNVYAFSTIWDLQPQDFTVSGMLGRHIATSPYVKHVDDLMQIFAYAWPEQGQDVGDVM